VPVESSQPDPGLDRDPGRGALDREHPVEVIEADHDPVRERDLAERVPGR
jgi:hypothetical protein